MPTSSGTFAFSFPFQFGGGAPISSFFPLAALPLAASAVRLQFNIAPNAVNSAGATDALNTSNYSLTGPNGATVAFAAKVSSDNTSIDLQLQAPLTTGLWQLTASNVTATDGSPLGAINTVSFQISAIAPTQSYNGGALIDEAYDILRKHLSPAIKGPGVDALLYAYAAGDSAVFATGQLVFDQLFTSSASGIYLDRRLADDGIVRPAGIGMSDYVFRQYGINVNAQKLTQNSILETLKIFYGPTAINAYVETQSVEPFLLSDQDTLFFTVDGQEEIAVTFSQNDFVFIQQAKATEVAAAITRACELQGSEAYAVATTDPVTNKGLVQIFSNTAGLRSSVTVNGGRAQTFLLFPELIPTPLPTVNPATISWAVSKPRPGVARFSVSGPVDFTQIAVGDYVNVVGQPFLPANQGSFVITAVSVSYTQPVGGMLSYTLPFVLGGGSGSPVTLLQYFEVQNPNAVGQSATEVAYTDLLFFEAFKSTIQNGIGRTALVAQINDNSVNIQLPATTEAVARTVLTGSYLAPSIPIPTPNAAAPLPMTRINGVVTVNSPGHGLSVGNQIFVDESYGLPVVPASVGGNPSTSGNPGTTDANWLSNVSILRVADVQNRAYHTATLLAQPPGQTYQSVLVAGGNLKDTFSGIGSVLATCERFELISSAVLATGQTQWTYNWIATASMPAAVTRHTATLVPAGTNVSDLLVVAGLNSANGFTKALYLYTPGTNSWSTLSATLSTARAAHTATALANGQILIAGGATSSTTTTLGSELVAADQSSSGTSGNMWVARCEHSAVALQDGRVLALGGRSLGGSNSLLVQGQGPVLAASETFNVNTGAWTRAGNMAFARTGQQAVLLNDGRVLVCGGYGQLNNQAVASHTLSSAEIWDPRIGYWTNGGKMTAARAYHSASLLTDGRVLVVGGTNEETGAPVYTYEYFDPNTGKWTEGASGLPTTLTAQSFDKQVSVSIPGGPVLVAGGCQNGSVTPTGMTIFIPGADVITTGGMDGLYPVASVIDANHFTYLTPNNTGFTTNASIAATVTPLAAETWTVPGPYAFDPNNGVAITSVASTLNQTLFAGQQYGVLQVGNALAFPDSEGWLCIAFGTSRQAGPVRYLGRYSETALALDYSYVFPDTIQPVVNGLPQSVTLLAGPGPYVPADVPSVGGLYLTDSNSGRVACETTLASIVGAGLNVVTTVLYPGDRGLGGEGLPAQGQKVPDKVEVWGSNNVDADEAAARSGLFDGFSYAG